MKKRDETIDRLRALAMIWVIVVHVLYWGNFWHNDLVNLLKSFCLFEMPLFFFVTGAAGSFGRTEGYWSFVFGRYKRVLVPYWVFGIVCALLTCAHLLLTQGIDLIGMVNVFISWIIPIDRQISSVSYLTWAIWFVPVYLCVILLLPLLKKMKRSKRAGAYLVLLVGVFVLTCALRLGWIQNVAFYSIWTYIGLFYSDIAPRLRDSAVRCRLGICALIFLGVMVVLYALGMPLSMQHNKFPPNVMFGAFSVVVMSMILLLLVYINRAFECIEKNKIAQKMLSLYSSRSMTVFLYQVFAFNVTIRLANLLVSDGGILSSALKTLLCLVTTIPLCAVLAYLLGRIEDLGKRK